MSNLNVTLNTPNRELSVRVNDNENNYTITPEQTDEVLTVRIARAQRTDFSKLKLPSLRTKLDISIKYVVVIDVDGSTFFEGQLA